MLVDSHCHLDRLKLDAYEGDLSAAINAAHERDIEKLLCVGISRSNRQAVVDIAERFDKVVASVGIHPCDVQEGTATYDELLEWGAHPKVVAIGESGLDYFHSSEHKTLQQESFATHLQAAGQLGLPVIVHTRDAREDTLSLIKAHGNSESAGVLHCFTENWDMAKRAMDMNYMISISGIVTFNSAKALKDIVKKLPLERLLVETDSPYLAPVPYRGKPNEPKYVREVAEYIAELKGISLAELAAQTSANFYRLFNKAA